MKTNFLNQFKSLQALENVLGLKKCVRNSLPRNDGLVGQNVHIVAVRRSILGRLDGICAPNAKDHFLSLLVRFFRTQNCLF